MSLLSLPNRTAWPPEPPRCEAASSRAIPRPQNWLWPQLGNLQGRRLPAWLLGWSAADAEFPGLGWSAARLLPGWLFLELD